MYLNILRIAGKPFLPERVNFTNMKSFFAIWIFLCFAPAGFSASLPPPLIGFMINNGEKFTKTSEVSVRIRPLEMAPHLVEFMQIGIDENLAGARWVPFSTEPVAVTLSPGDGEKFIYARLKDKTGNISPIEKTAIILDTAPPSGMRFSINNGARFTNDKYGKVYLQIEGNDAVAWQVSNTTDFTHAAWEALRDKPWNLNVSGGDGEKTVYARFKDRAGNVTKAFPQSISLDTKPPGQGEVIINNNEKFTRSSRVTLKVEAEGAHLVRIVDRSAAQNYEFSPDADGFMTIDWSFSRLQGRKVVRAYFMDAANNKTTAPAEAEIIYDATKPAPPKLVIDNGSKYTNSATGNVDLQVFLRENEPNLNMTIAHDQSFSNAMSLKFAPDVEGFTVPSAEDGLKTIYLKLTDEAGNDAEIVSSSIVLDRQPPAVKSFVINNGEKHVITPQVNIRTEAEDVSMMQISNNSHFQPAPAWFPFTTFISDWKLNPGDGEKTVYARFKDAAGNISNTLSAKVTLDTQPPSGKLVINEGGKFTNHPEGKVSLNILYDGADVMGMQISNTQDFSNAKLLPVEKKVIDWPLGINDGDKTVFLRLKDKAGNFSAVCTADITLDRQGPENGEIKINNGEEWIANPAKRVALSLIATDARKMKVSHTADFSNVEWMPYRTAMGWTLAGNEGEHRVYAIFADRAGNISSPVSAKIKSDFTAPVVKTFMVEGNSDFSNDPQKRVRLVIEVEDATSMAIDNIPITENSTWEPLQKNKTWILSNEDGMKTIYAQFKDQAGNVSEENSLRIMLDRVPPVENEVLINENAETLTSETGKINLSLKSNGAAEMLISNFPDFRNSRWETFTSVKENWLVEIDNHQARVYVKFRDKAGNISDVVSDQIKIQTTALPGTEK